MTIYLCSSRLQEHGVRVGVTCSDGGVIARVDPKLMLQLLINLVSNAIKFSHAKGKAEITVRLAEDRSILIEVKDEGIGIAEDDIARVARPLRAGRGVLCPHQRRHGPGTCPSR